MSEENIPCPHCGKMVSKTDKYCRNCGATLIEPPASLPTAPPPPQPVILSGVLAVAAIIASVLLIVKWLAKSFLVRYAGDSGSSWSFSTAASVTGYAYIADVVFSIIGIAISWLILPTFHVDTTDLNAAIQQMNDYRAQINLLKLTYTLPVSLLGITWKSYLGGLGTHFGTNEKCSIRSGFAIFFALSLIGLLISLAISL